MEGEVQALPDSILCWQADLQQTWRSKSNQRLHWYHTNYHLIFRRSKRPIDRLYGRVHEIRGGDRRAALFGGNQPAWRERYPASIPIGSTLHANPFHVDPTHLNAFIL